MRVNPNLSGLLNAGIQDTEQALNTAVQQLASGRRVSIPSDEPAATAANLQSLAESAKVDRYSKNGDATLAQAQMADSALSNVVNELNQAIALGTQGADGSLTSDNRAVVATQVQSVLSEVVSQANTALNGISLFAGTSGAVPAFVADSTSSTGYSYQGNSGINTVAVGDQLQLNVNVPGDEIFTNPNGNVLGSLSELISALSSGTMADIGNAVAGVRGALANISQQRVLYADVVNQINAQDSYLSQETISLTSQQQALTGVDMSAAISNLTQAQIAHSTILAASAKALPTSLLDYLK